MVLKTDLLLHTSEGKSFIRYDARSLIDRAAREGYHVLSITNHDLVTVRQDLQAYASERRILLIPGVEATIEGKHVLLYTSARFVSSKSGSSTSCKKNSGHVPIVRGAAWCSGSSTGTRPFASDSFAIW